MIIALGWSMLMDYADGASPHSRERSFGFGPWLVLLFSDFTALPSSTMSSFDFTPSCIKSLFSTLFPNIHKSTPYTPISLISPKSPLTTLPNICSTQFKLLYQLAYFLENPSEHLIHYFTEYSGLRDIDVHSKISHPVHPPSREQIQRQRLREKNVRCMIHMADYLRFYCAWDWRDAYDAQRDDDDTRPSQETLTQMFYALRDMVWMELMRRREELILRYSPDAVPDTSLQILTIGECIQRIESLLEEQSPICSPHFSAFPAVYHTLHNRPGTNEWLQRLHETDPQNILWYMLRLINLQDDFEQHTLALAESADFLTNMEKEHPNLSPAYISLKAYFASTHLSVESQREELKKDGENEKQVKPTPQRITLVALRFLQDAAKLGQVEASLQLAHCLYSGTFTSMNRPMAVKVWNNIRDTSSTALIKLSNAYRKGRGVEEDNDYADYLLRLAVSMGDPRAQRKMATNLYHGMSAFARDPATAFEMFLNAAAVGEPVAQFYMALQYHDGNSFVGAYDDVAMEWLEAAASNGHVESMFNVGLNLLDKDQKQAYYWLKKAAEMGDEDAQNLLTMRTNEMVLGNM